MYKIIIVLFGIVSVLSLMVYLLFSGISKEEQVALDYVTEMYAKKDRDLTKLMQLTGKKITKEGLKDIEAYLTIPSTAWIGSTDTNDPNKKKVYVYFSPKATKNEIIKGIYVEKKGERWLYSGDIGGLDKLPKVPFSKFEESKDARNLGVKDWTKIELKS
ncbi:hypothetical protein [Thermoactinomyces sp. DSM 45892]|uniref:hypothetical protein n=1 Tax=Thermoactinomyces sp. DSM 45892 TaxID=1882753 RepID=UPI00089B71A9|nr:hypothetical protein [Thermoactinomyces sp. DSM 45892]SDZ19996.1 hypothetical protein SAMN05444416_1162 [Thermoactinomyces sp. DSM 45892]